MSRILMILLCLVAGMLVYRALVSRRRDTPPDKSVKFQQPMVRCAHCGVFVPEVEALGDSAELYCSELHRQAGPRK
jgi:uncharacterized protein